MCLLDYIFGDVETGKDATDLHAGITALEASVVIRFLQFTRRKGFDGAGDVMKFHYHLYERPKLRSSVNWK